MKFNFFDKKRSKRTDATTFRGPDERVANPTATTIVNKQSERAEEVQQEDDKLDNKRGTRQEPEGVASEPTESKKADTSKSNDDKGKKISIEGQKSDEKISDEMLNFLNVSQEYTMTQVIYSRHSEYVPNAMPMFIILDECIRLMSTSSHLTKYYPNFNGYAVKLGFAFCYYFQIIRVKLNAGIFDGDEPSMISNFTKAFPFDTIDIPNVLFPYFRTIVGTKMTDSKYDWIVPTFSTGDHAIPYEYTIAGGRYTMTCRNGLEYLCPNIPAMMMILSSFGAETNLTLAGRMTDGLYTPFNVTGAQAATTGFNFANNSFNFADNAGDIGENNAYTIFRTCGASERFKFWNDDAQHARRHMIDSAFFGRGKPAVYATALPANSQAPQADYRAITNIREFLFLTKAYSPAFFGYLLEQMKIFCKFWKSDQTLEQVPKTGPLFTLINCHLRFNEHVTAQGAGVDRYLYADRSCGLEHPNDVRWYPRLFQGMTANFSTSRGGITRYDELVAFTFGTNSIPPIANIQAGNAIRNFRSGKYFEEDVAQSERYFLGRRDHTEYPGYKPMWEGWTSEVLAKALIARPT